ncbi:MAG TPA: TRAP transporter small permease subunit [Casimicrobiaceae bacterium]|nr:TRAP transporter small permease subunit [Casimicrobiaceae bacterium]
MTGITPSAVMRAAERGLGRLVRLTAWLALPLSLLLFAQWPLREIVQAYSREANDLAQILFALYVSVAITAATRAREHLAADALAHAYSPRTRRILARIGAACVLLPWAIFVVVTGVPIMTQSLLELESFPETFNPGYFLVKLAMGLLGVLVAVQALLDTFDRRETA